MHHEVEKILKKLAIIVMTRNRSKVKFYNKNKIDSWRRDKLEVILMISMSLIAIEGLILVIVFIIYCILPIK